MEFICGYFHGVLDKILIFIALKELLKSSHILNFHDHPRQSIDIHYWELQKGPKISVINSLKMISSKKLVVRRTAKASAIFLRGLKIHETSALLLTSLRLLDIFVPLSRYRLEVGIF